MKSDFDPLAWLEGLPRESSITPAEVRKIWQIGMTLPEGARLCELGVWQGRSACLLALIAKERHGWFIGIDNFKHIGSSKGTVEVRLKARGLQAYSKVIEGNTAEVDFAEAIDFLHIDADHGERGLALDCDKYLPLVKTDGIICFDDYVVLPSEPPYPDIKKVADQFCRNENWIDIGTADGMQFFQKGK